MTRNAQVTEPDPECVPFKTVFRAELEDIAARRDYQKAAQSASGTPQTNLSAQQPATKLAGEELGPLSISGDFTSKEPVLNAVGLSLSGGGIRSAAFCLGVLQALDRADVLKHVDYLSTVSGGGYIGSSLSAASSTNHGCFPFVNKEDDRDTPAVKHIRDYSNYLIPHGPKDLIESLVIYVRGLVANAILVLPWLLLATYVTVRSHPTSAHLANPRLFRTPDISPLSLRIFRRDDLSFALVARYFRYLDLHQVRQFAGHPAGGPKSANHVLWDCHCGYRKRGFL